VYKAAEYKAYARDPDKYKGDLIKITGTVIQVLEGDGTVDLRVAQNDDYDKVWYVEYFPEPGDSRVLEDDTVTVYGYYFGILQYESTSGATISVPAIVANNVDIK
jgi:hypothetical protein